MNIYITGCARTGTTMLSRMTTAFENTACYGAEARLEFFGDPIFRAYRNSHHHIVIKRNRDTFAGMPPHPLLTNIADSVQQSANTYFLSLIAHFGVRILNIVRDPRDVLVSEHHSMPGAFYVSPERLIRQHRQITWLAENAQWFAQTRYEDIVCDPDAEQTRIAVSLGLEPEHSFSDYPSFVQATKIIGQGPGVDEQKYAAKGFRPLSTNSIGNWKNHSSYVRQVISKNPEINEIILALGYEQSSDW